MKHKNLSSREFGLFLNEKNVNIYFKNMCGKNSSNFTEITFLFFFFLSCYISYRRRSADLFAAENKQLERTSSQKKEYFNKLDRREVPDSIPGRACRSSHRNFPCFFSRSSGKYTVGSLRKTPHGRHSSL